MLEWSSAEDVEEVLLLLLLRYLRAEGLRDEVLVE